MNHPSLEHSRLPNGRFPHALCAIHVDAYRYIAKDVFARSQGGAGEIGVSDARRGDDHGVDREILDKGGNVSVGSHVASACRRFSGLRRPRCYSR
jgi:hypothetical protein